MRIARQRTQDRGNAPQIVVKVRVRKLRADLIERTIHGKLVLNLVGLCRNAEAPKQWRDVLFLERD